MFISVWAACVILGLCLVGVVAFTFTCLTIHKLLGDLENANIRIQRYAARLALYYK